MAFYSVRAGDTLSALAKRYGTTLDALANLNGIPKNADLIYSGRYLDIPNSSDQIDLGNRNVTLAGSSGATINKTGTPTPWILDGLGGFDTIKGGAADDSISGGGGDDKLYGNGGNDYLMGSSGHDLLNGGVGNDILRGGKGEDELWGGSGKDVFVIVPGSAWETIQDFVEGTTGDFDMLDFSQNSEITSWADLTNNHLRITGNNAIIEMAPNSYTNRVIIVGITSESDLQNNVIFAGSSGAPYHPDFPE